MGDLLKEVGNFGLAMVGCIYIYIDSKKVQEKNHQESLARELRLMTQIEKQNTTLSQLSQTQVEICTTLEDMKSEIKSLKGGN